MFVKGDPAIIMNDVSYAWQIFPRSSSTIFHLGSVSLSYIHPFLLFRGNDHHLLLSPSMSRVRYLYRPVLISLANYVAYGGFGFSQYILCKGIVKDLRKKWQFPVAMSALNPLQLRQFQLTLIAANHKMVIPAYRRPTHSPNATKLGLCGSLNIFRIYSWHT